MSKFCLTKYRVDACWYGRKPAGTAPDGVLFANTMQRYSRWIRGLPQIADSLVEGTSVYVREVAPSETGEYLFSLWMTTSLDASACALKLASRPGERSEIEQHNYSEGFSPGCPMYVYVDTSALTVYTVKPEKSLLGGKAFFECAVRDFMLCHPEHEQLLLRNENGVAVAENNASQGVKPPTFRLKQSVNQTETETILSMAPHIRKLVHTVPVAPSTRNILGSFLGDLWRSFGLSIGTSIEPSVQELRYEVNVNLSVEELRQIIEHQNNSDIHDHLGFKVSVSEGGRIFWADKAIDQHMCELSVSARRGVYSATALLNAVKNHLQMLGGES